MISRFQRRKSLVAESDSPGAAKQSAFGGSRIAPSLRAMKMVDAALHASSRNTDGGNQPYETAAEDLLDPSRPVTVARNRRLTFLRLAPHRGAERGRNPQPACGPSALNEQFGGGCRLMSPEPTSTTREALLPRPELCGESQPSRGASTWSLPQSALAIVIARVPIAFTPRKSSRYFLLEHSRKVFVRPQLTCHNPLSSGPAATSKLLSKGPPFPGDQKKPSARSRVQMVVQDPFPGFWVLHH
jgi:hypothetical protein